MAFKIQRVSESNVYLRVYIKSVEYVTTILL